MTYVFYATLTKWKIVSWKGDLYIEGFSYGNPKYQEGALVFLRFYEEAIDFDARQYKTENAVYKLV